MIENNLPRFLTKLIDREEDIQTIRTQFLHPKCTWLTLVGEGGVGKTRLALAVAESLLTEPQFSHGIWFIPLINLEAGINATERLAATIGGIIKFTFTGVAPLANQLLTQLRTKRLLLILDNFEHLMEQCDFLARLLQAAPHVKILMTSRHRPASSRAQVFWVKGLLIPTKAEVTRLTPNDLRQYGGVMLFLERASHLAPSLELNPQNQRAIVQICQQVEGLPLGIELAASLIKQRSCVDLANALQHNYAILTTSLRDIPDRHRSIQAVLRDSWQFLTATDAQVLAQCAIFVGAFTSTAAQTIAGATLEQLERLINQCLLSRTADDRITMHPLVHQFAREQLRSLGSKMEEEARANYGFYYLSFAREQAARLLTNNDTHHVIGTEWLNIRVAWAWALEQNEHALLIECLLVVRSFFMESGRFQEGAVVFRQAAEHLRHQLDDASSLDTPDNKAKQLYARLLLAHAYFALRLAQHQETEMSVQAAMTLAQSLGDQELQADGLSFLSSVPWARGDATLARSYLEQALTLARAANIQRLVVTALFNLGALHLMQGNAAAALVILYEAQQLAQALHYHAWTAPILVNLGIGATLLGNFTQALQTYRDALEYAEKMRLTYWRGRIQLALGSLYINLGQLEAAQQHLTDAQKILAATDSPSEQVKVLIQFGLLYQQQRDAKQAYRICRQAYQLCQGHQLVWAPPDVLCLLGQTLLDLGRYPKAATIYTQAQALYQQLDIPAQALRAQAGIAQSALLQNDFAAAAAHIEAILPNLEIATQNNLAEPVQIFWICYQVLSARADQRAAAIIERGYRLLQTYAAQIEDTMLRRSFLENIPMHRAFVALAQSQGLVEPSCYNH